MSHHNRAIQQLISSAIYLQGHRIPAIAPTLSVMGHFLLWAPLTCCGVTLAQPVFQISVDNEVQHLFRFSSVSISIHAVLRIATVEAGNTPALGVTFHQPQSYTAVKPVARSSKASRHSICVRAVYRFYYGNCSAQLYRQIEAFFSCTCFFFSVSLKLFMEK